MIGGESASKTAEVCLIKLEKEGMARQTVANLFELKDFYGYADQYGLPDEAKTWLKEFHEAIEAFKKPVAAHANPPAKAPTAVIAAVPTGKGSSSGGSDAPTSSKPPVRGTEVRARTRPPESPKNI